MSGAAELRVCVADDQAILRQGLGVLLGMAGIAVVGEAADGEEAVAVIRGARPDAALLDVRMPRLSGPGVVARLAAEGILPPTILLTTFDDDEALVDGLRYGARGFLLKGIGVDDLVAAIRDVAGGGMCGYGNDNERLRRALLRRPSDTDAVTPVEPLSRRERAVLGLMSSGLSNRQIALALAIGEGTAKNHVSVVLAKLGVGDRTKAVLRAVREGLI